MCPTLATPLAALDHDVPKTTLKDRLSGHVEQGIKPGLRPYLEHSEETQLPSFIEQCASIGYGKSRKDIMHRKTSILSR